MPPSILKLALQLSRLEKYRSRRLQALEEVESKEDTGSDKDFGTKSKVSLLDQHSVLKKKAEGMSVSNCRGSPSCLHCVIGGFSSPHCSPQGLGVGQAAC